MFFSFDGIDGAGKSTQIALFVDWLQSRGARVVTCRDPGSTALGECLRDVLLHSGPERPIGPTAEMLLYMAARAQLVEEVIRPALADRATVVSDRYLLANVVYQAHAAGLPRDEVMTVGGVAIAGVSPDRTFVLDVDPEAAASRRSGPADRVERRGAEYRARLRRGYLDEARRDPERIVVVDASQSVEQVHEAIRDAASTVLTPRG